MYFDKQILTKAQVIQFATGGGPKMEKSDDSELNLGEMVRIRYTSGALRGWKRQFRAESGRSAAWLARYLGVVEVVGSNPAGPIFCFINEIQGLFLFSMIKVAL